MSFVNIVRLTAKIKMLHGIYGMEQNCLPVDVHHQVNTDSSARRNGVKEKVGRHARMSNEKGLHQNVHLAACMGQRNVLPKETFLCREEVEVTRKNMKHPQSYVYQTHGKIGAIVRRQQTCDSVPPNGRGHLALIRKKKRD